MVDSSIKISWFSCGVTSAVATKIALQEFPQTLVVFIVTGSEDEDSFRFLYDCERWFNTKILILRNSEYKSHFDVIERTRFINGAGGARCTLELKKKVRYRFEDSIGDWAYQVFGFDISERLRAQRFLEQNPKTKAIFPLIERGLSKSDCMAILQREGIELPSLYQKGFLNNNCIGCVKGGKSYWALVRKCFPSAFNRMADIERSLGHSCIKDCFLDCLPADYPTTSPIVPSCSLWCDVEFMGL